MKYLKNMLWMASGVGVGMMLQSKSKEIKKAMKKGTKEVTKVANQIQKDMKSN